LRPGIDRRWRKGKKTRVATILMTMAPSVAIQDAPDTAMTTLVEVLREQ
jgi:hypothetical protein